MALKPTTRTLTFRGAGEHDVSEVVISSGEHVVEPGPVVSRITYTISYKWPFAEGPETEDEFAESLSALVQSKLEEQKSRSR